MPQLAKTLGPNVEMNLQLVKKLEYYGNSTAEKQHLQIMASWKKKKKKMLYDPIFFTNVLDMLTAMSQHH